MMPVAAKVLDALWRHGPLDGFLVIGTHALYAYESAAGVIFDEDVTATRDVDLFYASNREMKFAQMVKGFDSMVDLLRQADPTFVRDEDQKESAVNAEGFSVDFLRPEEPERFTLSTSISGTEGDIYPVQALRSNVFAANPRLEEIVIGTDGTMAIIQTIDPAVFVEFKQWMSGIKEREPMKRRRDARQALVVQTLLDEGRLKSQRQR